MKFPNMLTLFRFFLIPVILLLIYSTNPTYFLLAIVLFILAIITDWLDGYIAKKKKLKSVFGTFFDPIVDKILILAIFFTFVDLDLIPLWMILILLLRELIVSGIRQVCSTSKRIVGANWMGKSKLFLQAFIIIYALIFLYFKHSTTTIQFFNLKVIYFSTLIMVLISSIFAINFMYWYKRELLSDI